MPNARIIIVGGGLSGLYAACLMEQRGITDYMLLEGRARVGGRIESAAAPGLAEFDRVDLGPTWFWPGYQQQLAALVAQLGLTSFAQHAAGDTVVERSPHDVPVRVRGDLNSPPSMRLIGGMTALVNALHRRLDRSRILCGHTVRCMRHTQAHLEVESSDPQGRVTTWCCAHALLAVPPRLLAHAVEFVPPLPPALDQRWRATATWMAPHAKYVAVYDTPFWRADGLSGAGRSAVGPLGEIHDACMPRGSAALFGFLGVPAEVRHTVSPDILRAHCRAQLARMFGGQAAKPRAEYLKDWALDPLTATAADVRAAGAGHHAPAPDHTAATGPWNGRFTGIASEWSPQFPGYVAGAIEAAELGVAGLPGLSDFA